jgi:nucleoid DNA-binding protein
MATKKKLMSKACTCTAAKKPMISMSKIAVAKDKPYTRNEMLRTIAQCACITKKQASDAINALDLIIQNHMKKGSVGLFKFEGLLKIVKNRKPAKKARRGINPFTGKEMLFKAQPAHDVIRVKVLKKLKEMIE